VLESILQQLHQLELITSTHLDVIFLRILFHQVERQLNPQPREVRLQRRESIASSIVETPRAVIAIALTSYRVNRNERVPLRTILPEVRDNIECRSDRAVGILRKRCRQIAPRPTTPLDTHREMRARALAERVRDVDEAFR